MALSACAGVHTALQWHCKKQNMLNEYFVINLTIRWEFYLEIYINAKQLGHVMKWIYFVPYLMSLDRHVHVFITWKTENFKSVKRCLV